MFLLSFVAAAAVHNFDLVVNWTDTTPTGPDYTPAYDVEYHYTVDGGAPSTPVQAYGLTTPSLSTVVSFDTGTAAADAIYVRARNVNVQGPIQGAWSPWVSAGAECLTTPATVDLTTGGAVTVTCQ